MYKINIDRLDWYKKNDNLNFNNVLKTEHNLEKALSCVKYKNERDDRYGEYCPSAEFLENNYCTHCGGKKREWIICWEKTINESNLLKFVNTKQVKNK